MPLTGHSGIAIIFAVSSCCFAEITGPDVVPAGRLAVFESDIDGSFNILPRAEGCWDVDSGGKKLFFASPTEKVYTLIHCGIKNGKPILSTFEFSNGTPSPEPDPNPNPNPKPNPVPNGLSDTQKNIIAKTMDSIVAGIDAGTIRTPQGARSTFKNMIFRSTMVCNGGVCTLPAPVTNAISEWEKTMDVTTLDGIREGFVEIATTLKQ
ncbi:MAG: hypothetical protein Q4D98_03475 [Planctomycetia bacterium]|nr:hypothetical protein [Planctomycetia bacterium]